MTSKFPWIDALRLYPRGLQRLYPDIGDTVVGSSPLLWSPYSLGTKLQVWWNTASISGSSGDQIQTVLDISANSHHGVRTTSLHRALLRPSFFNGVNMLDFNHVNCHGYDISSNFLQSGVASEAAMYTFLAIKSDPPTLGIAFGLHNMRANSFGNTHPGCDGIIRDRFFSNDGHTMVNPTVDLRSFHLTSIISKSGFYNFLLDANCIYSSTANVIPTSMHPLLYGYSRSAAFGGAAQNHLHGYQSDMIIVAGALSSGDNAKMEGFLLHKHALQSFLPAGHPYINSPPT